MPWLSTLHQHRAIAVLRPQTLTQGLAMAQAVAAGGIHLLEVTWNSPAAPDLVRQLQVELPDCTIGVGTVLTVADLDAAIAAGAQYCFTPHTNLSLIQRGVAAGIPMIPGALTPSEVVAAWQAGASSVKVFPVSALGGAAYLTSLQGPLGHVPLIPTGGVTVENSANFLAAGAIAVGLASDLFQPSLIAQENWAGLTQRAQQLVQAVAAFVEMPHAHCAQSNPSPRKSS
jgi:2-dehydro-3-deoxyphosphogluconate aldolase/(4S)-4-hydroxy-2-oxoglutarate aldolase